jgi:hypothetical protein
MARISISHLLASGAEWLAWTRAGPDWSVCWPSSVLQGERPSSDSGEEMALGESGKFMRLYLFDATFIHDAIWYMAFLDKFSKPRSSFGIELVVIIGHF